MKFKTKDGSPIGALCMTAISLILINQIPRQSESQYGKGRERITTVLFTDVKSIIIIILVCKGQICNTKQKELMWVAFGLEIINVNTDNKTKQNKTNSAS